MLIVVVSFMTASSHLHLCQSCANWPCSDDRVENLWHWFLLVLASFHSIISWSFPMHSSFYNGFLIVSTCRCRGMKFARTAIEGRGKNHLLPRYWPRINDQELQQLSGEYPWIFCFFYYKMNLVEWGAFVLWLIILFMNYSFVQLNCLPYLCYLLVRIPPLCHCLRRF